MYVASSDDAKLAILKLKHCSGAIELPELQSIVFEYKSKCFYLTYGKSLNLSHMNSMILDIDDGFCFKEPDACTDNMRVIRRELQKFFSIWKDNNYQGMLFDQSMGLDFTNDVPASLPEPKPSTLLFAHEDSIASVYPSARPERDYHLTTYIASGNTLFHFPSRDPDDTVDNIKIIYRGQG